MNGRLIFKDLNEYLDFLHEIVNSKQPTLDFIEVQERDDGQIEATLHFAPI